MSDEFLTVLLSLTSALLFAVSAQTQNLGLRYMDSRAGALLSIGSSAVFYWLLSPFFIEFSYWLHPAVLIFVLIGLFRPALSANLSLLGMRYLGPTLVTTLASTSPLFGAMLGVLWLGEVLTWPIAIGTAGIMAAVMVLSLRRGAVRSSWPLWALALPVGAGALRALAHALAKVGMGFIPSPIFAGLVGFTVSALVTAILHRARHEQRPIPWGTMGPFYFALSGIINGFSVLSMNTALKIGQIIVVVPIVAASPIFTLLLSLLIFRQERLTSRAIAAVFLVVPAVILIAISR